MASMPANISQARTKLLFRHPFFATLLLRTPQVITTTCKRASVDGKNLYINPDWVKGMPVAQVMAVLVHEVMHIALCHISRRGNRHPKVWNWACDFFINLVLRKAGLDLPVPHLYDPQFEGLTVDEIYKLLMQEIEAGGSRFSLGSPGAGDEDGEGQGTPGAGDMEGDLQPDPALTPAEIAGLEQHGAGLLAAAANAARMMGKLSADMERLVGENLTPKVRWQDELMQFMLQAPRQDEDWSRRNRRYSHVVLPGRGGMEMGPIALIGDTSGSISQEELDQVGAEVKAIISTVRPSKMHVIWADAKVCGEQEFDPDDDIKLTPKGNGGTDMRVPLEYVERFEPEVVILITDGHTPWPNEEPPYPLIVCCTTSQRVPIGTVIRM